MRTAGPLTDFTCLRPATSRNHTRQEAHKYQAPVAPRTPDLSHRDAFSHHAESNAPPTELRDRQIGFTLLTSSPIGHDPAMALVLERSRTFHTRCDVTPRNAAPHSSPARCVRVFLHRRSPRRRVGERRRQMARGGRLWRSSCGPGAPYGRRDAVSRRLH